MEERREESAYAGPLPMILDDGPFQLSYMNYDESRYPEMYRAKAEAFLQKMLSYGHKICHAFSLSDSSIRLDERQSNYGLPENMTALCSPAKYCRERVRFPIYKREAFRNIEAIFPDKVQHFRSNKSVCSEPEEELVYTMWEANGGSVLVHSFPIASKSIYHLMPRLLELINATPIIRNGLKFIHFHSTTTGDIMALLTYNYSSEDKVNNAQENSNFVIDEEHWIPAAEAIRTELNIHRALHVHHVSIIGRSKGQKIVLGRDFVQEQLHLPDGRIVRYKQVEQGFSNPNSAINAKVLGWMSTAIQEEFSGLSDEYPSSTSIDLLEMFCGNGNHTVALSPMFRQVFAVEINGFLVDAARENLELNHIHNARVLKCDSSTFAMRVLKQKQYTWREKIPNAAQGEEMERIIDYNFQAVIVDPPRAGLDSRTIQAISQYPFIIYISCNPDRLLENLTELSKTHKVTRLAIIDHFAYTPHLEVAVLLKKL